MNVMVKFSRNYDNKGSHGYGKYTKKKSHLNNNSPTQKLNIKGGVWLESTL